MNDSDYPEQYFINLVGNINNQVALEIGSRSDRGSPYVRSKSSGGYTEWKRILTNADLEYSWENFTIGVFATEATVQRQGLVKCLKINTYLKNTTTGITGNQAYTLATLATAYRPKTSIAINTVVGRVSSGTTSTPLFARLEISTSGVMIFTPFQNITTNAISLDITYI